MREQRRVLIERIPTFRLVVFWGLLPMLAPVAGQQPRHDPDPPFILQGKVVDPSGAPAAEARIAISSNWPNSPNDPPVTAICDQSGKFSGISSRFGFSTIIHAASADNKFHAEMIIPDFLARTRTAKPLRIQLRPSDKIEVQVIANGQPVEGCHVTIDRLPGQESKTNSGGVAAVWLPKNCAAKDIVAFHAVHGVASWRRKTNEKNPRKVTLQLEAPAKHDFRVFDQRDKPVPDFRLKPFIRVPDRPAIRTASIAMAHLKTNNEGVAKAPWLPRKYDYIDPVSGSPFWQVDNHTSELNVTTIRVRRKRVFLGQVRFPDGMPRAGVLLVATSFGPGTSGDHSQARTDMHGKFRLYLAPDHAYVLGVRDPKWATKTIGGVFLRTKGDSFEYESRGTILKALPATQVTVKVEDSKGKPMDGSWVNFGLEREISWVDEKGKEHDGVTSLHHWIRTDSNGLGVFGTLPGKVKIRVSKNSWNDAKELEILDSKPVVVTIKQKT